MLNGAIGFFFGITVSIMVYLLAPPSGLGMCALACIDSGHDLATCKEALGI